MIKTTLLVDGSVLLKRSFNGAKHMFHKEQHIGGLFQFYTTLRKIIIEQKIDKVVVMWDGERGGTLRLDYYPEYKGNRPRFFDQSYEIQKLRIKQYAEELFIRQYQHSDCESDDLIAFYCLNKKQDEEVVIYTNDRDLCQLISPEISLFLADKKQLVGIGNYSWYFEHHYKNAGLVKIIEGCTSDFIKGVTGVTEKTLIGLIPELKTTPHTLEEVINKCKDLYTEKPSKTLENIINGKSNGCHKGPLYEINDKIINLNNPLLTDDAKEEVLDLINLEIDGEGRSYKNVLKMMIEDGFMKGIPGGESGFLTYMEPFIKLVKKQKPKRKLNY